MRFIILFFKCIDKNSQVTFNANIFKIIIGINCTIISTNKI